MVAISQMLKRFNSLTVLEKVVLLVLFVALTVMAVLRGIHVGVERTDIHVFWRAGHHFYAGEEMYNLRGVYLQYLYPPFAAMLFGILSIFPLKVASVLLSVFNVVLWFACFYLTKRILEEVFRIKVSMLVLALTFAFTINFYLSNLNLVQVNLIVFYLSLLFVYNYLKGKYLMATFFLAFAICFKVTPIIFVSWLFFRGRFKPLMYVIAWIFVLMGLPMILRGFATGVEDVRQLLVALSRNMDTSFPGEYNSGRAISNAINNYFITFKVVNDELKALLLSIIPVFFGVVYVFWLIVLRVKKIAIGVFEFSGTFLIILLCSATTGDAHMVTMAFPIMTLLAVGFGSNNTGFKYFAIGVTALYISPIGALSPFLLHKLNLFTLLMFIMYFAAMHLSFKKDTSVKSRV